MLGIWIDAAEGAKFWLKICNELATRGVEDVIFVCVDGLKGLPEGIEAVWPQTIVQTCVVHLVRASTRYVSYKDRKAVCANLREIYHAVDETAALDALERFEARWNDRYPAVGQLWRDEWGRFTPMLDFPPEIRRVLSTFGTARESPPVGRGSSLSLSQVRDDEFIQGVWTGIRSSGVPVAFGEVFELLDGSVATS